MRYFADLEDLAMRAQLDDDAKIRAACKYISLDEADLCMGVTQQETYEQFKTAVIALYPGAEDDRRFTQSNLTQIVRAAQTRGVSSRMEEGQYYQDFTCITLFLLSRGRLSAYERDRLYLEGFEASPLHAIKNRLAIKVPDQNLDDLMAERIDAWHDMYPGNLFGDGLGPSAAPPPNISRDGRDQPPHMVSLWEIAKEAFNPKEPSLAYIEECLDDSTTSVLEANVAPKKKTVRFDDSAAGKSAKHPPGVPASQVPASILKSALDPSAAPRGGTKASLPSPGNRTTQYSYKTPVEDKVNVRDIFERVQNEVCISLTHRELMALCPEICKLEKEEITAKRVVMMGSFEAGDCKEVAEALLVDIIAMRRDIWECIGSALQSEKTLNMESANMGINQTLGRLANIRFGFSEMELYLQAHVLNDAPFEVLLGQPFFTLTACKTLNFTNGHIGEQSLVDGRVPHIPESASSVSSLSSSMNSFPSLPSSAAPVSSLSSPMAAVSSLSSSMDSFPSLSSSAAPVSSLSSSEELFPWIISLQIEEPHILYTLSSSFCSIGAASSVTAPAVAPGAFQIEHEAVVHGYGYKKVDKRVKPVPGILADKFQIMQRVPCDPMQNLPSLPFHPPDFIGRSRYTEE
ncbi:hypothetical protein SCP_0409770 [Sparassis crispa]|uniref:Uncharacterized protein n=1 Tax=Sparassis crispa TaxID=139825 RepID=A0A401GKA0_9APHY|nr:hypothetical protein SCP_0409770 [Sparassis crispa]GBE82593.1 hypothetical protein SCP_0409770 [Sparassis crispa]